VRISPLLRRIFRDMAQHGTVLKVADTSITEMRLTEGTGGLPTARPRLRRLVEPRCGYLPAADVLLLCQDLTHPSCIDAIVGCNVMLMLPTPMTEPNINSFLKRKFSLRQRMLH
jgi:hypothetical protein